MKRLDLYIVLAVIIAVVFYFHHADTEESKARHCGGLYSDVVAASAQDSVTVLTQAQARWMTECSAYPDAR